MNIGNNVSTVRQHQEEYDFKITKHHFPRDNNDSILEFIFEKDPNLYMRKNKIVIRGAIELDNNVLPDNGYVTCMRHSHSSRGLRTRRRRCTSRNC